MTAPSHAPPHKHTACAPGCLSNTTFFVALADCWILICWFLDIVQWLITFFNSTACRPPTPLPCSESQRHCRCHQLFDIARKIKCFNVSPSGAILLPSSPLELTPAGLPGSPCCSPAGLASPSLSRASLLLQEARLSVLLLLLPLKPFSLYDCLQKEIKRLFTCCS